VLILLGIPKDEVIFTLDRRSDDKNSRSGVIIDQQWVVGKEWKKCCS